MTRRESESSSMSILTTVIDLAIYMAGFLIILSSYGISISHTLATLGLGTSFRASLAGHTEQICFPMYPLPSDHFHQVHVMSWENHFRSLLLITVTFFIAHLSFSLIKARMTRRVRVTAHLTTVIDLAITWRLRIILNLRNFHFS